ncbi:MAG: TetR/AcrR family transcriptional regulator [Streptosporangiaceae bacterium]
MGRPSLAAQRREQIFDAVMACVSQFGVEGTTLERVSEASGLGRGHVRHYVGNREEMLEQFQVWLLARYIDRMQEVAAAAPAGKRGEALVRFLFGKEWAPSADSAAIDALMWAAARDERIRSALRSSYLAMERALTRALRADYPHARPADCSGVAYTLICLAFAHSTLMELSFPSSRQRAVDAVSAGLLASLRAADASAGAPEADG